MTGRPVRPGARRTRRRRLGAAMLAGVAAGTSPTSTRRPRGAVELAPEPVLPRRRRADVYAEAYARYRAPVRRRREERWHERRRPARPRRTWRATSIGCVPAGSAPEAAELRPLGLGGLVLGAGRARARCPRSCRRAVPARGADVAVLADSTPDGRRGGRGQARASPRAARPSARRVTLLGRADGGVHADEATLRERAWRGRGAAVRGQRRLGHDRRHRQARRARSSAACRT